VFMFKLNKNIYESYSKSHIVRNDFWKVENFLCWIAYKMVVLCRVIETYVLGGCFGPRRSCCWVCMWLYTYDVVYLFMKDVRFLFFPQLVPMSRIMLWGLGYFRCWCLKCWCVCSPCLFIIVWLGQRSNQTI
jgi:hypothetical protein